MTTALLAAPALAGETDLGAVLPDAARQVGEHRYKSPSDWEGTMKFYRKVYSPSTWRNVINQPGVKAIHIPNPSGKGQWLGLNIYEANEEVRIYVVPNEPTSGKGKPSRPKK
ncbi:MAG: hypothetical protein JNJ54_28590 [Myxococcaceae bacterium]|nr:hypothetical protein [Myxococcaceae bacterium]